MESVIAVVGALFVVALWDIGRRIATRSDAPRLEKLEADIAALKERADAHDDLADDVAELGTKVQNLGNKIASMPHARRWGS